MYKRIFTFGCSFTNYIWPTWADIIAEDLNLPYKNFGISGLGNVGIATLMLECDLKYKFTDSDLILVNWSSWHREDRVGRGGEWRAGGSIFNNVFYDDTFINKYWSEPNDIIRNSTAIISSNRMYKIHFQSHMIDYEGFFENIDTTAERVGLFTPYLEYDMEKYKFYVDSLPKKVIFNTENNSHFDNKMLRDDHPDIMCHLNHATTIYQSLGLKLKPATINKYIEKQQEVIRLLNYIWSTDMPIHQLQNNYPERESLIINLVLKML